MQNILFKIFISLSLLINFSFLSNSAFANLIGNFKVSKKATKVHQRRTIGSGSRSRCIASIPTTDGIELLVPNFSVAHHTSSSNPSLYLYSRIDRTIPVVFTLVDPTTPEPLVERKVNLENSGITKISLPNEIKLEDNIVYMWYVAIPCQNNPQYSQTVLNAGIEKVEIDPSLATKLNNSASNLEKIEIYSANGLWYETIDLVIQGFSDREVEAFLARNVFSQHSTIEKNI